LRRKVVELGDLVVPELPSDDVNFVGQLAVHLRCKRRRNGRKERRDVMKERRKEGTEGRKQGREEGRKGAAI
jgi:hypothetical protein